MKKLKLYVWEDVLEDYTPGIMFALATSVDEARILLLRKCSFLPDRELRIAPRCVEKPEAFIVWGGG